MDDDTFTVGRALPRLASVRAMSGGDHDVEVTWREGEGPAGPRRVDLSSMILSYRVFAPLRDAPDRFADVRLLDHGSGIGWGAEEDGIDMSALTVEHLGRQTMSAGDFVRWRERHGLSLSRAAAALGVGRRRAAYYDAGERVPRTVCLAARCLDVTRAELDLTDHAEPAPGFEVRGTSAGPTRDPGTRPLSDG